MKRTLATLLADPYFSRVAFWAVAMDAPMGPSPLLPATSAR